MLKRLELTGFKSFADRARFDFAPGLTAVVGPNGSGKSNIVDAVRWILGEQSAKTLRGGEMTDVIFNGSSTRKSLGMAEVTVAFDNARRLLAVDADEVQITRRVYRDGTGEYEVNGQEARLKDVKDIFLGSGAGANGYTVIAQGRVDELLAASNGDRREIFEEAAGISRFKAKKAETLRKLAGVEQNLLRSRDRLDALDAQLRTLQLQAAKAQRYREHSDRLRELRVGLGLREYRDLTARIAAEGAELRAMKDEVAAATGRTDDLEGQLRRHDREVGAADESLREEGARAAEARRRIAEHGATLKHERAAAVDREAERLRVGRQQVEHGHRVEALKADSARAAADAAAAADSLHAARQRADEVGRDLGAATDRLARLEGQTRADREAQFEVVGRAAALQSQADSQRAQLDRLRAERARKRAEATQTEARRLALGRALDGLSRAGADVRQRLAAARARSADVHSRRDAQRDLGERVLAALGGLRDRRRSDLRGRTDVLEGLERSLEGLGTGVRDVLGRIAAAGPGHPELGHVEGIVADLLAVPRESAPLIDLALGDAAQRFVVRDGARLDALVAALGPLAGRVGFVPLTGGGGPADGGPYPTADALVRCERPDLAGLPRQLLGDVVVADDLPAARRLRAGAGGRPLRFLTRDGDLIEPDGSLTVGPLLAGGGIVSRKSELRELRGQLLDLDAQIAVGEIDLAAIRRNVLDHEVTLQAVEAEIDVLAGEAGGLQQQIARQQQQLEQLAEAVAVLGQECALLDGDAARGEALEAETRAAAGEAERDAAALRDRLEAAAAEARAVQEERARHQLADTEAQVAVGRAAADRDRARERLAGLEADARKRRIEAVDLSAAEANARSRLLAGELAMLRASDGMALAYREREDRERRVAEAADRRAAGRAARDRAAEELTGLRAVWQERQAAAHARELAVRDATHRRDALAARLHEDYGLDLALEAATAEAATAEAPGPSIPATQLEIEDLRKKLARLGSVNVESLEELARVEAEAKDLHAQHDDLADARRSLEEIIDRINADSRKLFAETLAAVRVHFQELFRKLFAGGQADILLEDEADVLESGVEIAARPPGKELRSISLLSGGEKTLTAIALLLAIFRNKPSPFCLLDEVDAALDEANTQRLAGVLWEFRQHSQFIVITHKKRTMAVAEVLHGVTMQESGVSKQVAVRFEDWPQDEEEAAKRAA